MNDTGLIAILRGVTPGGVVAVGEALVDAGIRAIEVPLNSPEPFTSVERLATSLGAHCVIGAGTVLTAADVARTRDAGGQIVVAPNCDPEVIDATIHNGLLPYPGVATPTEAFAAARAGARHLKLFPADTIGIAGMTAWRAVLPSDVEMLPVGGIDETNLAAWSAAGAGGAGLGSALYRPGDSPAEVGDRARAMQRAWTGD
ncbi:2-dehydro-3-deoxy-6-phosphogalactonate aldolase [Saccharomonospora sp. CUA-673]|uniref:2-dehydro-3-deoxy-6-phosphogalactonate aldolase n=1 Tax=Saccharomonospora sp. CUA-673 TaxID=1904969 RepID=UPI00096507F3|nr:2-dehydro-3-deoxy-6-phosphogalactonate aldolase [Saccharomonospora sp. CUA-673]OLT45945.1 2-dehydro-3-deoxy-6-phosphogalactonate aldolase [Saccharomonospora sp. CUA-673]